MIEEPFVTLESDVQESQLMQGEPNTQDLFTDELVRLRRRVAELEARLERSEQLEQVLRKSGARFGLLFDSPPDTKDAAEKYRMCLKEWVKECTAELEQEIIDRKQKEEILKENLTQLRLVVQNMPVMMDALDDDLNIVMWNRECERVTGYSAKEIIGNPQALEWLYPDPVYRQHLIEKWHDIENVYRDWECELVAKDGTSKTVAWFSASEKVPILDWVTWDIGVDVTERKRVEQLQSALYRIAALSNSETRMDELYPLIHEILGELMYTDNFYIALYDPDNDLLRFPYFVDEMDPPPTGSFKFGKGLTEYVIRTGQPQLLTQEEHNELIRQGELELVGSPSPIWLGVPLRSKDQIFGVMAVQHYEDVCAFGEREAQLLMFVSGQVSATIERRRTEAILQELTHELGERVKELNCLYGISYLVEESNLSLSGILQGTVDLVPLAWQYPEIACASITLGDQEFRTENFGPCAEELSSNIVVHGRQVGHVTVCYLEERPECDEGPFTKQERNLLNAVSGHLSKVIERLQTEEAREKLVDDLEAFAGAVAHDLGNPLTAIISLPEILAEDDGSLSDEAVRMYLGRISQNGRKMQAILQALLQLARVPYEQIKIVPLDMSSIMAEVQEQLSASIQECRAELVLPDTWPKALGYGPWIEQVWVNYLSNALKYGGTPPRLEVGATPQTDGQICFWVRDNGLGIPLDKQSQLFIPFTKLRQDHTSGHGLGLSIVRRSVEKLGGAVGVESKSGQGSTFFFTLPSADASA